MKNVLLALLFIVLVAASIFGVPPLLRYSFGVDQPIMTVISSSMWPELSRGDIVFVKQTSADDIKVGSVIVFRHQGGLAVHRVVSLNGWTITTKGDANVVADEPILYSDVVGRVPTIGGMLVKIPWVGNLSLAANSPDATAEPGQAAELGFWGQLRRIVLSPLGFIIIIGFPLIVLFQNFITDAINRVMPMSPRKRRLQARAKRLQARWGEEKAKRALRL